MSESTEPAIPISSAEPAVDDSVAGLERLLGRFDFARELAAKETEHQAQMQACLLSFVEVMDSFDRLFDGLGEPESLTLVQAQNCVRTAHLIARQLDTALRQSGVTPLDCCGEPIDSELHEVVDRREAPENVGALVLREITKGYLWKGEMLRRPQVVAGVEVTGHREGAKDESNRN